MDLRRDEREKERTYPLAPISGKRDCVASSTVSLNASEGEWPFSRRTLYWARNMPSVRKKIDE
jgi:hypothetical protein